MTAHDIFMRRCLELAALGAGHVSPNPMVGAVIVYRDRVIGEGFHQKYGQAHAEVNAIKDCFARHPNAAELLAEATAYVSLEPCAHHGKTPPCADLLIEHRLKRVVIGCRDPFTAVDGRGIEKLKAAGMEVITGILEEECRELNRRFFSRVLRQRPYIVLKWAQTADGFFAPADGTQRWITSAPAKTLVHRWRSEEDAVMVGKNTARADNPRLTVREWNGRNPVRIVLDRRLELDHRLHLFDQEAKTIVFNELKTDVDGTVHYISLESFDHYLPQTLAYQLYLLDIQSVLIEGGAKTLEQFIAAGLWDEARIFTGPECWGNGQPAPLIGGRRVTEYALGEDFLTIIRHQEP